MTAALLFVAFAAVAFYFWMATGARWFIWVFVAVTLALAIDAAHPGVANQQILLPIALNIGG